MPRWHRLVSGRLRFNYNRFVTKPRKAKSRGSDFGGNVAMMLYTLRRGAGLSQTELAEKLGTSLSTISRLEDPDYQAHSLTMLRRIAAAVDHEVEIRFVVKRPAKK